MDNKTDISCLVTKDGAEDGVWIQADLYGRKQPFEVCVIGADADAVILHNKQSEKEASKALGNLFSGGKTADIETADDIVDKRIANAVVRMAGLRSMDGSPLMLQGIELKSDKESYSLLCRKVPAMIDFVVSKSNERENFLPGRKKD